MDSGIKVFSLTPLTRSSHERRTVILGADILTRYLILAGLAAIPGLLATAVLWAFIGSIALFALPIVIGAAFLLIERRSNTGLRLRTYQTIQDKRGLRSGIYTLCGQEINPTMSQWGSIVSNTVPVVTSNTDILTIAGLEIATAPVVRTVPPTPGRAPRPGRVPVPDRAVKSKDTASMDVHEGLFL